MSQQIQLLKHQKQPLTCPSYLRDHNELDCGNPSFARYEGSHVSRLLPGLSRPDQIELIDYRSCGGSGVSGLEGESREMQLKYMPENGISGNTLEHMRLPDRKAQKITDLTRELRLIGHCTLRQIQCLLGHLNFANFVIHRGRLHCRHLQRFST